MFLIPWWWFLKRSKHVASNKEVDTDGFQFVSAEIQARFCVLECYKR